MGKHPAWPDFIDDAGVYPPAVVAARDALWTRGLQRACQLGAFEQIPDASRVALAHHALVATRAGTCVARVWASGDAKSRGPWPMIAMAHGDPLDASWLCEAAPARLYAAGLMASETRSRQLVSLSLGEAARQIEDALALVVGVPKASVSDGALLAKADANKVGAAMELVREGLAPDARGDVGVVMRLPRLIPNAGPLENARMWLSALRAEIDPDLPVVLLERDDGKREDAWVDVIVGHGRSERWSIVRDGAARDALAGRPPPSAATLTKLRQTRETLGQRVRGATGTAASRREVSARSVALLVGGAALVIGVGIAAVALRNGSNPSAVKPADVLAQPRGESTASGLPGESQNPQAQQQAQRVTAQQVAAALSGVQAESAVQGVSVPADLLERARRVIADDAQDQVAARAALRELEATSSELAGRVLAEIRTREVSTDKLDEAERTLADAWRARLQTVSPRDGMQAVREQLDREGDVFDVAMRAVREARPDAQMVKDEPVLARAIAQARQEHAAMLARLVRDGAPRETVAREAQALRETAAALTHEDGATGRADRVPALRRAAREGLARGATWTQLQPVHAALKEATQRLDAQAAAIDELRRMEAVARVADLPAADLLEAMRAASADASGRRVAEVMEAWRRMTAEGVPVATLAAAYADIVKPALLHVDDEPARLNLQQEAAQRGRDAWIRATRDETDDATLLERDAAAATLDAQPPTRSGDDVPAWSRAHARLAAAKLRRALAENSDDAALLERARALVDHVDAAGDALDTWPDAKRLRALAQLSRDALAQASGTREWLGRAGPGAAGWKLVETRDDGVVRFEAPDGTALELARQPTDASDEAVYVARGETSVGEVLALLRDAEAKREILGALWQFDPQADPRTGPCSWTWTNGRREMIAVPRAWHAPLADGSARALAPGVDPGAPTARTPMNYVSFRAAEAIAKAMGCRLLTQAEWRGLAGGASGAVNGPDATWKLQDALAQRLGVRAANARGDTGWGMTGAGDDEDDGTLWLWASDRGAESARFANIRGNVAEWLADGTIAGGSAMTADQGPVRATTGDALRGFADVGLRVAFSVPKSVPTNDALQELRAKGRK